VGAEVVLTRATPASARMPATGNPVTGPTGTVGHDGPCRWKPALNAFAITFADGFPVAETC
jgi:hypothetical protein